MKFPSIYLKVAHFNYYIIIDLNINARKYLSILIFFLSSENFKREFLDWIFLQFFTYKLIIVYNLPLKNISSIIFFCKFYLLTVYEL